MTTITTPSSLALVSSLETAWQDVDSSFERFCLTAGIGAIEQMLSRRHSCIAVGQSLRGPGAGAARRASLLRSYRTPGGAWIEAASRSWLQLHVRRLPGRNRMPGDRSFALLRARTRGQWRRRAIHPNLEGEPAVGEDLRYHRRTASRAHQVCQALQRNLARRPARLSYPSPSAGRPMPA